MAGLDQAQSRVAEADAAVAAAVAKVDSLRATLDETDAHRAGRRPRANTGSSSPARCWRPAAGR